MSVSTPSELRAARRMARVAIAAELADTAERAQRIEDDSPERALARVALYVGEVSHELAELLTAPPLRTGTGERELEHLTRIHRGLSAILSAVDHAREAGA